DGTVFTCLYDGDNEWFPGPLWSFNGSDGGAGNGDLIFDSSQNLYGTTLCGGGGPYNQFCGSSGNGVVFELNPYNISNTATTLTSSPNPSTYGQAVTFTSAVTPAPPDGETVSFQYQIGRKSYSLGSGTLLGGSASLASSGLPPGTDSVVAAYGGDSKLVGSASKALKQGVTTAGTTTALASSLNPSNVGQSVTFTASVSPKFSGTPTGTMVFYDGTGLQGSERRRGGAHNQEVDLGHAHHHGNVRRQQGLYRQFGCPDTSGELGIGRDANLLGWRGASGSGTVFEAIWR